MSDHRTSGVDVGPLGFLFGPGFDTATEAEGWSPSAIMVFPALFAASMSLIDTFFPSWPGLSGPSPHARAARDGPDEPGHDEQRPMTLPRQSGRRLNLPAVCCSIIGWRSVVATTSCGAKHVPGKGRGAQHPRLAVLKPQKDVDAGPSLSITKQQRPRHHHAIERQWGLRPAWRREVRANLSEFRAPGTISGRSGML